MKRVLLLAAAGMLFTSQAFAWDCSNGCKNSTSSNANAVGGPAYGGAGYGGAGYGGAGGSSTSKSSARGGNVVNNINGAGGSHGSFGNFPAAPAIAPSMFQTNNCSGSPISGAVQSGLFGLSFGTGNNFDNVCRLHMLGLDNVAFAYICQVSHDVRKAALAAGHPCPQDSGNVPTRVIEVPMVPDWCSHLSDAAERAKYRYVCALPGAVRIPGSAHISNMPVAMNATVDDFPAVHHR